MTARGAPTLKLKLEQHWQKMRGSAGGKDPKDEDL
jgi:hypothetical protein